MIRIAVCDDEIYVTAQIENKIMQDRNIPQKYKGIFIDGLENLKETMPNLNLSVLNQHLKRGLKIVEKTSKEITNFFMPKSRKKIKQKNKIKKIKKMLDKQK